MIYTNLMYLCLGNIGAYNDIYTGNKKSFMEKNRQSILLTQKYINLFTSRFNYNNLPEETLSTTCKNKINEVMLYFAPAVAWFIDSALGLQVLPVTGNFKYDIAGFPTEWEVFGANGYRKKLTYKNSVLMFNDTSFSIPFVQTLYNLALMLECDFTHKQNIRAQRQPLIFEIEEEEKKSASAFVNKLNDFSDTIMVRKKPAPDKKRGDTTLSQSKTFESGRQFEGEKLGADYRYFENRIFTYFGYNNENIEKRERLLVDEVNGNNQIINSYYTTAYNSRKEAIENVNKMFGTNISITPNILYSVKEKEEENKKEKEEKDNGNIESVSEG